MRQTLPEQIAANKRASFFLVLILVILLAALGTAIVGTYAPRQWWIGTVGSVLLALGASALARKAGPDIMLSMSGAREATGTEHRQLQNVVEEMAIASGLPMPRVYVIDSDAPNAFATGSDPQNATVAITTGLMRKLDRDELQGVMAHELAHIRNYDIRFMTMVGLIAGLIPLLADAFREGLWWTGGGRRRDRDDNGLGMVFMIVGLLLSILAPIFAALLHMAVSRRREYLADVSAAEMTRYPEGLARALQKISTDATPLDHVNRATEHMYIVNPMALDGGESSLFSTHPPTSDRIRRLMSLAGTPVQTSADPLSQMRA
jgi:heat shock protein HtpX